MVEKILKLIPTVIDEQTLLLVQKLTESAGLFVSCKRVIYLQKTDMSGNSALDTEMLSFASSILVSSVANDASFQSGQYSAITYKGPLDFDKLSSFALLTESYAKSNMSMGLEKFFYSLIDLFQMPQEQKKKNLVGLFGEIKFIECIWTKFGIDIAANWHTQGVTSKYDFVFNKANVEIKTTTGGDLLIPIKHSQLFNGSENYLIIMSCEFDNSGETLNELISKLLMFDPFKKNLQFQFKLLKERTRVSEKEAEEMKLAFNECLPFKASALKTLENIPTVISQITYNYDFSSIDAIPFNMMLLNNWS